MACFERKQWSTTSSLLLETIKPPTTKKNPNKSRKNKKKTPPKVPSKTMSHGSFMGIPIQNKAKTPTLQRLPGEFPACRQLDGPGEDEVFAQPQQGGTPF